MDTLIPSATVQAERQPSAAPGLTASAADDWFRPCALIIVDADSPRLSNTVNTLVADDLPCLLVGSGKSSDSATRLDELAGTPGVHLIRHVSGGRGAAILHGLREAARLGYSHAAQVDANGRDDLQRVSLFLDRASQAPDAVICSHPQADTEAAQAGFLAWCVMRLGRLSASVRASLCELRVYPLATTLALAESPQLTGARHYDSELLLRMHGQNQPIVWLRTASLPGADGRSCGKMGVLGMSRFLARAFLHRG